MSTGSNDVDEIYHRMAVIRREPHTNVRESVAGAEAIVDWGRYTWTYPWIALGAATAAGYLMYTSGHQKAAADTASPVDGATAGEPVAGASAKSRERSRSGKSLLLAAGGILLPVAVRAGQNYLAALARTTIPQAKCGPDRSVGVGWGAERLDRPG